MTARDASARARALSRALLLLMLAQALLGLLWPEAYRDEGWTRETWFGNDLVTLLLGLPALGLGLALARRGSGRGALLWLGGLGYAFYNYAFYLVGAALNAFLPLYAALSVLSAAALGLALGGEEARRLAAIVPPRARARAVGGYLVFVALGLAAVWIAMWAAHVFGGRPIATGVEPFKIVAALDLTIMVPALALGGTLLWRGARWGLVVAAAASVQAALYLVVLALNALLLARRGFAEWPGDFPLWAALAAATALAAGALLAAAPDGAAGDAQPVRRSG